MQFLILGFDANTGSPHIFEIGNPGICSDHRSVGYWAIGSGAAMALASITSRPLAISVEEVLIQLCEAKFSAETASGVGNDTLAMAIYKDGTMLPLLGDEMGKLREIWKDRMMARPSFETLDWLRNQLKKRASGLKGRKLLAADSSPNPC